MLVRRVMMPASLPVEAPAQLPNDISCAIVVLLSQQAMQWQHEVAVYTSMGWLDATLQHCMHKAPPMYFGIWLCARLCSSYPPPSFCVPAAAWQASGVLPHPCFHPVQAQARAGVERGAVCVGAGPGPALVHGPHVMLLCCQSDSLLVVT